MRIKIWGATLLLLMCCVANLAAQEKSIGGDGENAASDDVRSITGGDCDLLPFGQFAQEPWGAKYVQTSVDDGTTPGENWYMPDFDDSAWSTILGPISNKDSYFHATSWEPEGSTYWVRRCFTLDAIDESKIYVLHTIHDDGCKAYLNGKLVYENEGVQGEYNAIVLDKETLKEGENLLAVVVSNSGYSEAYMDFGLYGWNQVTDISLSDSLIVVRRGEQVALDVLFNENTYDKSVIWSTANGGIASVSESGIISGNGVGQTTVTVVSELNPEVSATCLVSVYEPDSVHWLLPWGKDEAWSMKYKYYELSDFTEPAADANGIKWTESGYDDTAWESLSGPMASEHVWYGTGNYLWEGEYNCFCLRRTFTLQDVENSKYYIHTQHDDDIKVYVNGKMIVDRAYYNAEEVGIYTIPNELLVVGENTLAIYIQQLAGDAYLDYAVEMEERAAKVTISADELTLKINELVPLTAITDGSVSSVIWSVADNSVAMLTEDGRVKGRKTGTTTITARAVSDPTISATCTVTVTSEYAPMTTGWLQPMGEEEAWTMKYQFYELADLTPPATDGNGLDWYEVGYDDSTWGTLTGPLGGNTPWDGDDNCFFLRGTFVLPGGIDGVIRFNTKHDDNVKVYINGVLVSEHDYDMGLHEFEIPDSILVLGQNTIAVYAQENGGEAYFDYGLYLTEKTPVTRLELSTSEVTLRINDIMRLVVTTNEDAHDRSVIWSVADSTVVTVTQTGMIQGIKAGTTVVTATSVNNPEISASCTVTVTSEIAPITILPWGKDEAWTVKYLFYESDNSMNPDADMNGKAWYEHTFDDSSWNTLTGPIGDKESYNHLWTGENNCFYLRRSFHLSSIDTTDVSFYANHDNGIEVYLNGQLVVKNEDWTHDETVLYTLPNDVLVLGENMLAIYIKQEEGSTYLDYALYFEDTQSRKESNDSRIVSVPEGTYYVYYTDRDGGRRYLYAAGEDNWTVSDVPQVVTFSAGNVSDERAFAQVASLMESNGYYMSAVKEDDATGPVSTVDADGVLGSQKRTWESQVFYQNEAGKYAIRLTNTDGTDWRSNYFVNVNTVTLDVVAGTPTLGEEFYLWELEYVAVEVNLTVNASHGGVVTGGGTYVAGTEVTLTATPNEGYRFVGWSDGETSNPYTFILTENKELEAVFALSDGEQTDEQGVNYLLNETADGFVVTGCTDEYSSDVVIPETLYDLPVTTIQAGAFAGTDVETIVIPSTVTYVGEGSFSDCRNLLVIEWNAVAPLDASCFDGAEAYGNMLVFVTNVASIGFEGNVVVDGVAEEIRLTDGKPFRNPKQFMAGHISYSREFTKKTRIGVASGWEGIVLPFEVQSVTSESKGALYPFNVSAEGIPYWIAEWLRSSSSFVLAKANLANQPFIMEVPNSEEYDDRYNIEGTVTFSAENATVSPTVMDNSQNGNGFQLVGTYEGIAASRNVYALNDDDYLTDEGVTFLPGGAFVADSRDIRPFEAYIYNPLLTRSRYLPIDRGGSADGLPVMMLKGDSLVDVYTIQGVLIRSQIAVSALERELPAGIYIVNNKKVIVR